MPPSLPQALWCVFCPRLHRSSRERVGGGQRFTPPNAHPGVDNSLFVDTGHISGPRDTPPFSTVDTSRGWGGPLLLRPGPHLGAHNCAGAPTLTPSTPKDHTQSGPIPRTPSATGVVAVRDQWKTSACPSATLRLLTGLATPVPRTRHDESPRFARLRTVCVAGRVSRRLPMTTGPSFVGRRRSGVRSKVLVLQGVPAPWISFPYLRSDFPGSDRFSVCHTCSVIHCH